MKTKFTVTIEELTKLAKTELLNKLRSDANLDVDSENIEIEATLPCDVTILNPNVARANKIQLIKFLRQAIADMGETQKLHHKSNEPNEAARPTNANWVSLLDAKNYVEQYFNI